MKRLWLILFFITPLFTQELLEYSIKLPKSTQSKMPALFLMHGYGGNEKQFNQLIETYNDQFLIVSMRAPFSFLVFKNRWYEYSISDDDTLSNQVQIAESTKRVIQTIEHIKNKHAIDEKRIFVGGFSQGAIMSYKLALLYPQKFSGLIAHSARLPVKYSTIKTPNHYNHLNVLIIHGSNDKGLTTKWALEGKRLFEKLGSNTEYFEIPIGHEMTTETIDKIVEWLSSFEAD